MAYVRQTWKTGDIITAEKLNNIEDGIVTNKNFIIKSTISYDDGTIVLDKTFEEIVVAAKNNGLVPIITMKTTDNLNNAGSRLANINEIRIDEQSHYYAIVTDVGLIFAAESRNDYPFYQQKEHPLF